MNINSNCHHLYVDSIEEVQLTATASIEKRQRILAEQYAEHKEKKLLENQENLLSAAKLLRQEFLDELSGEKKQMYRRLTDHQIALKKELFSDVEELLNAFKTSPAYEAWICQKIIETVEYAGIEKIMFYLSPEDQALKESIESQTGIHLLIAEESFWGGVRAYLPEKDLFISHTLLENFTNVYKEFRFALPEPEK